MDGKQQQKEEKPESPANVKIRQVSKQKTQAQREYQSARKGRLELNLVINPNLEPAA